MLGFGSDFAEELTVGCEVDRAGLLTLPLVLPGLADQVVVAVLGLVSAIRWRYTVLLIWRFSDRIASRLVLPSLTLRSK